MKMHMYKSQYAELLASLMSGMYPTTKRFTWYGTRFDRPLVISGESCTGAPNIPDIPAGLRKMGTKFLWERFITMQMIILRLGM